MIAGVFLQRQYQMNGGIKRTKAIIDNAATAAAFAIIMKNHALRMGAKHSDCERSGRFRPLL